MSDSGEDRTLETHVQCGMLNSGIQLWTKMGATIAKFKFVSSLTTVGYHKLLSVDNI